MPPSNDAAVPTTAYTGRFASPSPQELAARLPHLEVHEKGCLERLERKLTR